MDVNRIHLVVVVLRGAILLKEMLYIEVEPSLYSLMIVSVACQLLIGHQSIQIVARVERVNPILYVKQSVHP